MIDLRKNLIFLYHQMVASESLLEQAVARSTGELQRYFLNHLEEERGHAQWLAEDLASDGIDVKKTLIPVEAMESVGSVYYLIFHVDTCALLGYMLFKEQKEMPGLPQWERDYPVSLLRTLKYHAEHDPEHASDLRRIIGRMTGSQQALIDQTYRQTEIYWHRAVAHMVIK